MKKNVLWWPAVVNDEHTDKYGGFEYYEYSRKSLEYWCKRNDVIFVPYTEPIEKDFVKFRPQWQKCLFVFDELERMGIDYDQIWLLDSSAIIKWDAPNIFELTDRKFVGVRDMDNMRWVYESVEGYKSFFDNFEFDMSKYINSGCIIFNETHKELFKSFKQLYYDNQDTFIDLQDNKVRKGNDQTPLNYWLQINDVDMKLLPFIFNSTHMHKKELFSHNWQLQEDKTPFFLKYSYVWRFTGIPKNDRTELMRQVWAMIEPNYNVNNIEFDKVLDTIPHKDTAKWTTSRKLKEDILRFFSDDKYKDLTMMELGSCQGNSTLVYSNVFKKVYGVERDLSNIEKSTKRCDGRNVEFIQKDIYREDWDFPNADVVMVDAGHNYEEVMEDVQKSVEYFDNPILIIDDYGNPNLGVKKAVDELINRGVLNVHSYIGEDSGFKTAAGWVMNDREGIICNI